MTRKIKKMYVIIHNDEAHDNVMIVCNTESQAKRFLKVVADGIAYNEKQEVLYTMPLKIWLERGTVWVKEVPLVTAQEQLFRLGINHNIKTK